MTRRTRIGLKVVVWAACLTPLAWLAVRAWQDDLSANPIDFVTDWLGRTAIRLLMVSLALTPLRIVTGLAWPIMLRRLLGLFAFFYAALHFGVWIVLDHYFAWPQMGADIVKRPYITVGVTAVLLMIPLAVTSTSRMIKRLGGRTWQRLHRLVYVSAVLAVLHFLWLAKVGRQEQYLYVAILVTLLGVRVVEAWRRRGARRRAVPAQLPQVRKLG
jgi:sulfoxide reductase heme-binding subunit YedZ